MHKGRASLTALAVASFRALASGTRGGALIDPRDRVSRALLPAPLGAALGAARMLPAARLSLGLLDHVALRTAMLDRLLASAAARGVRQVVILGAGLDARAHRLEALRDTVVYEVDHPDGQRVKRERARNLEVVAEEVRYVAADLELFGLTERLREAGHDPAAPSFLLLEGLAPYLRYEAFQRVLHELAGCAAAGSQIAITYVTPDMVWLKHLGRALTLSMRLIGEPLHNPLTQEGIAALLRDEGFTVEHDSDSREWARELAPLRRREPLVVYERLVVASR